MKSSGVPQRPSRLKDLDDDDDETVCEIILTDTVLVDFMF